MEIYKITAAKIEVQTDIEHQSEVWTHLSLEWLEWENFSKLLTVTVVHKTTQTTIVNKQ